MYTFKKEDDELVQYVDESELLSITPQLLDVNKKEQCRLNIDAGDVDESTNNSSTINTMIDSIVNNTPIAKVVKYASSDITKGSIEERLTELGF